MPEVNNPLYETGGPIYEEIPGEKNFNTLIREQQPTGPGTPSSEYVTIEGKMNGGAMHYNVIRMQGTNSYAGPGFNLLLSYESLTCIDHGNFGSAISKNMSCS